MVRTGLDLTEAIGPFALAEGPSTAELRALREWLPARRWFPSKLGSAHIAPWFSVQFQTEENATIHLLLVTSDNGSEVVLQVPVTRRPISLAQTAEVIGRFDTYELVDGCLTPQFWQAWLAAAQWGEADAEPAASDLDLTQARPVSGEQSNTSISLPNAAGGTILKIFRTVASGPNPDVDIPRALAQTGWSGVPRPLAWLELRDDTRNTGLLDLGVLSELVPDAADGFANACAYAAGGLDFTNESRQLGQTIAEMHAALRTALPTDERVAAVWIRSELRRRARQAAKNSAEISARMPAIEKFLGELPLSGADGQIAVQRIHGDLHLGQTLWSDATGWRVLDFEGEPMRPLAERHRPDLAIRDVAGMLRSFEYAAVIGEASEPGWAAAAREAFLAGYMAASAPSADSADSESADSDLPLLAALELDKALYEVVYEANNRPDWVWIPLGAVDRILTASAPEPFIS